MQSSREDVYKKLNMLYALLHQVIIALHLESKSKTLPKKKMFTTARLISTIKFAQYDDLIKKLFEMISYQNKLLIDLNKKDEKINLKEIQK